MSLATAVATAATTTAATTGNIVDLLVKVGIASLGYVCVTVIDKINYLSVVLTQNCAVELLPKLTVQHARVTRVVDWCQVKRRIVLSAAFLAYTTRGI